MANRSFNKVMLIGYLGADPVINYLQTGTVKATMSLAVSDPMREGRAGKTHWFEAIAWGGTAENCAKYLKKGSCIFIEGSLQVETWLTKEKQPRRKTNIKAFRVVFLDSGLSREYEDGDTEGGDIDDHGAPF